MLKVLGYLLLFLALAVGAFAVWVYSGVYDVAADQPPARFEDWVMETVRHRSIERRTEGLAVPELASEEMERRGFELYRVHCVTCHGAPGVWPEDLAMGLYPVPPSLDAPAVQDEEDAELFWIVKNGIKFTGMPAFGPMQSDEEVWSLVAFIRRLPQLSPEEYKAMAASPEEAAPPEAPAAADEAAPAPAGAGEAAAET